MSFLDEWLKNTQLALLGPRCLLCRAPATLECDLCAPCTHELPWSHHACRYCALTLSEAHDGDLCRTCARTPRFDAAITGFTYDDPIRWLITRLKFDGRLSHARLLGDLLARRIADREPTLPDLLVPVPLHRAGYRRRGFNQAERIARRLSRTLGTPLATADLIERARDTARQSTLAAHRRAANVRGAFVCPRPLHAEHVAIVDDVVTTGQTATAVADCLRRAGATRVDLYCVARA